MSFVRLPDPHPGRCQNFRYVYHGDGYTEAVRCLDYEHTVHVCSFPNPTHVVSRGDGSWGTGTTTTEPPKRWVKP